METDDPINHLEPDQFRAGEIWENSRGTRFRVVRVERRTAHMVNESTGRTYQRAWDDLGWKSGRPWLRIAVSPSERDRTSSDPAARERGGA